MGGLAGSQRARVQRGESVTARCASKKGHLAVCTLSFPAALAFLFLGRAPMLVYVRPSNEALLRARVPGAQDQCGCRSNPFYRARSASKKGTWPLPSSAHCRHWLKRKDSDVHVGVVGKTILSLEDLAEK